MTENAFTPLLAQAADGINLSREQAERAFQIIMNGGATPAQIAAFITALRVKGETVDEISAGAEAIRAKTGKFAAPKGCMDTCGTGGDKKGTLNISTAVAFVLAAAGVPVAKHGGRAVSSKSGSADVLDALGVRIDAEPAVMERSLRELNICFLFAPLYHKAMRHVAPVRQELGLRTVFNLLGPLCNPARPEYQLVGVYAEKWVEPVAHVLKSLGVSRALVVHGKDGMDELSVSGPSAVAELMDGAIRTYEITPEDAGLPRSHPESLAGGTAAENAKRLQRVLLGEKSPYRDAVVLNASAALVLADKAPDLVAAAAKASEILESGAGNAVLQKFIIASRATAMAENA